MVQGMHLYICFFAIILPYSDESLSIRGLEKETIF